jgi:site-specific recombinase XerD
MFTAVGYSVLIRSFRLALRVDGLRPHTIDNYVREAERFAAYHGDHFPHSATPADIRAFTITLGDGRSAKTVYEAQLGLRRFFRFLVREGEIERDPTSTMKLTRYRVDPQPTYTNVEVKSLLMACSLRTPQGIRDRAVVMVLYDTGVREGELVSMSLPDWDTRQVKVEGKGGVRFVPLGLSSLQAVERYVRRWGIDSGALWRGKKGPLTGSGVHQLVGRLCGRAGVDDKGVHAFRRAAAAQMKRLGMQDSDILEVMGWKDITMLRRYIAAVAGELAQEAHQRFSPGDAIGIR